jgi:beta-phosphoglucomutase-like phosphatase (HAD superfamily)
MGISPNYCLVIEDSVFGVEAAKKAGMACIAVTTGAYSKQELQQSCPDLVVSSLLETDKIFRLISDRTGNN